MVLIRNFPNRMYADQAQEMLEENGIASLVQSDYTGSVGLGGSTLDAAYGVDLYVADEEAEEAKEILDSHFADL